MGSWTSFCMWQVGVEKGKLDIIYLSIYLSWLIKFKHHKSQTFNIKLLLLRSSLSILLYWLSGLDVALCMKGREWRIAFEDIYIHALQRGLQWLNLIVIEVVEGTTCPISFVTLVLSELELKAKDNLNEGQTKCGQKFNEDLYS